ncbi:MAG TPA: hypothetical protein DEA62_02260 [Coxiellaceae bacterium]|nr:hypothetical protein [Coxiellaceae bacterium]
MIFMAKPRIACCYYPTTVVFIDDNRSFLDNVVLGFDESINTITFTEPTKAIGYLRDCALVSFTDKYLRSFKEDEDFGCSNVEHSYVDVNVFNIHKEIYNPHRFDTVIVVVVDYTMPEMNGLELCRILKGLPFKFILITGDATLNSAIEAFNAGLIHKFIPKSCHDFTYKLQNVISELQEKQFEEFSDVIIKNLSTTQSAGLGDPLLIKFLKEFFKNNNIVEYYLVTGSGCFLLMNSRGDLSWMAIKTEEEMAEYTNTAIDNYGEEKLINELLSREKILFLCTEADHINVTVNDWEKYLYPATRLIGDNNVYYYSHIKEMVNNIVCTNRIISYEKFLAAQ